MGRFIGIRPMKSAKRYIFLFVILPCLLVIPTLVLMMFSMRWDRFPEATQIKSDLNAYASAIALYKLNHGEYPPSENWYAYLTNGRKQPLDPWGDPYIYEKKTVDGITTIELYSSNSDPKDPDQKISFSYDVKE